MYVSYKRRGLGDTLPVGPGTTADVFACSPDICLSPSFPWFGRRSEAPQLFSFAGPLSGDTQPALACECKPVFDVPAPWGAVISAGIAGLVGFKLLRAVMG
jgi:hypothetical protein